MLVRGLAAPAPAALQESPVANTAMSFSPSFCPVGLRQFILSLLPPGSHPAPQFSSPRSPNTAHANSSRTLGLRSAQKWQGRQVLPISFLFFLLFLVSMNKVPWHGIYPLAWHTSREVAASSRHFFPKWKSWNLHARRCCKRATLSGR